MSPQEKYRAGVPLSVSDLFLVKRDILQSGDVSTLESLIYVFGSSFSKDEEVLARVEELLFKQGAPGLSAVCLKVATEFWGENDSKYLDLMAAFLDYDLYDDWYDEVIFSSGYARRHPGAIPNDSELLQRLLKHARANDDTGLVDLLTQPSR